MLIIVNFFYLIGSRASIESCNLFASAVYSNCPYCSSYVGGAALENVMRTTRCALEVNFAHKIGCHGNVPRNIEKNNFRSFVCGQSSTNPANFVKIGPVDVDKNHKNVIKIKHQQNISLPRLQSGWVKMIVVSR